MESQEGEVKRGYCMSRNALCVPVCMRDVLRMGQQGNEYIVVLYFLLIVK